MWICALGNRGGEEHIMTYFDSLMTVAQPTTQCSGPTDSSAAVGERERESGVIENQS